MHAARLPTAALVALVGTLAVLNLVVTAPAGADVVSDSPEPTALPDGAALTGDSLIRDGAVQAVQVRLQHGEDGLALELTNPDDEPKALEMTAVTRHSTGSLGGRMGPMTTVYQPQPLMVSVPAGERVVLKLKLAQTGQVSTFLSGPPLDLTSVTEQSASPPMLVAPAPPAEPEVVEPADGAQISPLLLNPGGFDSWSVTLTASAGDVSETLVLSTAG